MLSCNHCSWYETWSNYTEIINRFIWTQFSFDIYLLIYWTRLVANFKTYQSNLSKVSFNDRSIKNVFIISEVFQIECVYAFL